MEGSDRGAGTRRQRLLRLLAGAVAGCPGLEVVATDRDGRRSEDAGSGHVLGPSSDRDAENQQRDLVSVRDRIGLGCSLFPGCGAFVGSLVMSGMLMVLARSLIR